MQSIVMMGGFENSNCSNRTPDNVHLKLSGSQINLACRPQVKDGKTFTNTHILSPNMFKRPKSAVPDLHAYKRTEISKNILWMRPQSADNAIMSNLNKTKLTTRYPLSSNLKNSDNISASAPCTTQEMQPSNKNKHLLLPSTKLLETLLSEPVMRSWAHPHMQSSTSSTADELSEEIDSSKSDDPSDSEISLGTKIQMLAQKNQSVSMRLIPGIKHKPPLPIKKSTDHKSGEKYQLVSKFEEDISNEVNMSCSTDFMNLQYPRTQKYSEENGKSIQSPFSKQNKKHTDSNENYSKNHLVNLLLGIEKSNVENTIIISDTNADNFGTFNNNSNSEMTSKLNEEMKIDVTDNKGIIKKEGLSFQRWLKDNIEVGSMDTVGNLTEQSDIVLESLKKQQEEFSGCLLRVEATQRPFKNEDWSLECLIEEPECLIEESECLIDNEELNGVDNNTIEKSLTDNAVTEPLNSKQSDQIKVDNSAAIKKDSSESNKKCNLSSNNIQNFSLEEYDAKLKRDTEFLSLELSSNLNQAENNFASLCNNIKIESNNETKEHITEEKCESFTKFNLKEINDTDSDIKISENVSETEEKATYLNDDKLEGLCINQNNSRGILKKDTKRKSSPELKTCEDVMSWMSFKDKHTTNSNSSTKCKNVKPIKEKKQTYLGNISEKPERDLSAKNKSPKTKALQNVISTIPSTYNDIVSIIHVLEEGDMCSEKPILEPISIEHNTTIATDCDKIENNLLNQTNYNKKVSTNMHLSPDITLTSQSVTASNYSDLITYLDEIDRSCAQTLNNTICKKKSTKEINPYSNIIPNLDDLISLGARELAHQVLGMHLQLEEKSSSIKLLQDTLCEQKKTNQKTAKQFEIENKKQIKSQKEEYEAIIKRHQKFIDQLIADKKTLSDRCEKLMKELHMLEERHVSSLKAAEHKHAVELQRAKDMQAAGEKLRRERWIDSKTQKIKELTVKSLEPELQSMQNRHQQEISDLRILHKREIEELELRAARKTQQHCEALREQLSLEKEDAIAKERELMRQRLEKLSESEEKSYQEQRMRLMAEIAREKKRLEEELSGRIADCISREQTVLKEKERELQTMKIEFDDHIQILTKRYENEIKSLKENLEIEKESWKSNFKKQQTLHLSEKEAILREQCRRERDREIELVIERLENEANETKKQSEQLAENRIKRLVEKYTIEMKDLEASEEIMKKKYGDMKNKLVFAEENLMTLEMNTKRLEVQYKEVQEINDKLMSERNKMREIIRDELKSEVTGLEKQIVMLKEDRNREIQQVYTRVKIAVARKDETINALTNELKIIQERCIHLEDLLQQQRKEYLIK